LFRLGERRAVVDLADEGMGDRFLDERLFNERHWRVSYSAACRRGGAPKSSGKWISALITGYGVKPPSAHSDPNFKVLQRSSSSAVLAARFSLRMIRSITSMPRVEPTRHGVHLPQDSMAQNSMAKRACFAISTVSSNTTMPPWPIRPSRAAKAS